MQVQYAVQSDPVVPRVTLAHPIPGRQPIRTPTSPDLPDLSTTEGSAVRFFYPFDHLWSAANAAARFRPGLKTFRFKGTGHYQSLIG